MTHHLARIVYAVTGVPVTAEQRADHRRRTTAARLVREIRHSHRHHRPAAGDVVYVRDADTPPGMALVTYSNDFGVVVLYRCDPEGTTTRTLRHDEIVTDWTDVNPWHDTTHRTRRT